MPSLRWTLAWLLLADLVTGIVAPLIVPQSVYLHAYLGRASLDATRAFLATSTSYLVWDSTTGWKNRPGSHRSLWIVDAEGARRSTRHPGAGARLVLFLGDSVTNGGTAVSNDETISALVEDDRWSSANFATMLYGVDQMFLALPDQLRTAQASVVVVGLTRTSIEALGNRYVPLRRRSEVNMPFLKPRFILRDGRLALLPVPGFQAYDDLLGEANTLTQLADTDDYFHNFSTYRRTGFLPLSGLAASGLQVLSSLGSALRGDTRYSPLLQLLMRALVDEGAKRGARTVFLLHATAEDVWPPKWRRVFPDRHGRLLALLRRGGFDILDAREALRASGRSPSQLYSPDGLHYRAEGNRVMAGALQRALVR